VSDDTLRQVEAWTKIISALATVAIPVAVAVVGSRVQTAVEEQAIDRDYVRIAVSVLAEKDTDPDLKHWAGEVLASRSPIPLSNDLRTKLNQKVTLPRLRSCVLGAGESAGEW